MDTTNLTASEDKIIEFATFYVGDLLIGIDIQQVQEINRQLDSTDVPHTPDYILGVINLRGEVVTVLDLRVILNMPPAEINTKSRNIIINSNNERIGLLVDSISDVVIAREKEIEPPPANISGADEKFFQGVYKLEDNLLVILDVEKILFLEVEAETKIGA